MWDMQHMAPSPESVLPSFPQEARVMMRPEVPECSLWVDSNCSISSAAVNMAMED